MLKHVLALALVLATANAFAAKSSDSTTSTQMDQNLTQSTMAVKGFRIGLVKGFTDIKTKVKFSDGTGSFSGSDKEDSDQKVGLSVGYAQIPIGALGVSAALVYDMYEPDGEDLNILRGEGSLTYGLNSNVYLLGGLNIERIIKGLDNAPKELEREFRMGFGLQVGVGAQITKNIGLDLVYLYSNHKSEGTIVSGSDSVKYELSMAIQGPQLSLTGTF